MVTNHFGITGIGTVMMNYCKALDKKKYDLTILAGQPISEKYEKRMPREWYSFSDTSVTSWKPQEPLYCAVESIKSRTL